MWRCRTASAPWAGRSDHSSVVDAAGAIYVIGGYGFNGNGTYCHDVWVSTDGGAQPDAVQGGERGVLEEGTQGGSYSRGYTRWVLRGYSRGSLGIPTGHETGRPIHPRHAFRTICSPSVAGHVNAAADAITCMACMSLGKNCVFVDSCGRARPRVC
jgi:hypothetical protein